MESLIYYIYIGIGLISGYIGPETRPILNRIEMFRARAKTDIIKILYRLSITFSTASFRPLLPSPGHKSKVGKSSTDKRGFVILGKKTYITCFKIKSYILWIILIWP